MARSGRSRGMRVLLEPLESRELLSAAPAVVGNARPGPAPAPSIELGWVALHEFGHALGLAHSNDANSIMYPYYNPGYNFGNFASDSAVLLFKGNFSSDNVNTGSTPWKDSLDGTTDGKVWITFSWMLDGDRTDTGARTTTNSVFPVGGAARAIILKALDMWAQVSGGTVGFRPFDADGIENASYAFGVTGKAQGDDKFGDIRIATHKFDGASKTLAHTYYPPPNGGTAAGDAHFDEAENWATTDLFVAAVTPAVTVSGDATTGSGLGQTALIVKLVEVRIEEPKSVAAAVREVVSRFVAHGSGEGGTGVGRGAELSETLRGILAV